MSVGLWAKVTVVVWVCVWGTITPVSAHSSHRNPYLDPEAFELKNADRTHQEDDGRGELSNDLAIQVHGGQQRAIELARKYGLRYVHQVFSKPDVYHLHAPKPTGDRSRRDFGEPALLKALAREPGVEWVDQQVALVRDKRHAPKYDIYRYQDRRRGNPQLGGKTKTSYNIPADVQHARQALDRTLRRFSEKNHQASSYSQERDNDNVIDYWKDEEKEDDSLDQLGTHGFGRRTKGNSDGLVRIPLTRNIGYGYGRAEVPRRTDQSEGHDVARRFLQRVPKGRTYALPFLQTANRIKTRAEGDEGNDEDKTPGTGVPKNTGKKQSKNSINFNDPLYGDQWYLRNTGQLGRPGNDLNVTWAWEQGYTGRGIVLSVLDDGLQTNNSEIADNYESSISYSLVRDGQPRDNPMPRLDPSYSNSHGTYCAAIMAAVPNNSVCGVGVAYHSKVGGVRIVDGKVTDIQEATALSRHIDRVDIFSASWGPTDDGTKVEGPGKLARHAFKEGITKGRGGKGIAYVWASGNGGISNDNCNLDGYTSSIYTMSVSALTDSGRSTFYEEPCASTLAAVYVGGDHSIGEALERRQMHKKELRVIVPELDGHCSETFQGTSAAAPLMAGIVALVLQANGNLTWRDLQHLVVETSSPTPEALQETGWQTNGRGKKFHLMQGFGAVNGGRMVEAALKWKNVKPQKVIILPMFNGFRDFHPNEWLNITHVLDSSEVPPTDRMTAVEHVIANITVSHPLRKLLTIFIVSPSGTTSQVLTHRDPDKSKSGFTSWGFMSVHFWGENPEGTWKVALKDDSGEKGFLKKIEMTIYGT